VQAQGSCLPQLVKHGGGICECVYRERDENKSVPVEYIPHQTVTNKQLPNSNALHQFLENLIIY
jgi:hypothetical protein